MPKPSDDEPRADLPFVLQVIPISDQTPDHPVPTVAPIEPWPERKARPVFHDGWGVKPLPPQPAKDEPSV